MKISIAISALILAAAAGLGWQIDGRLAAARTDERKLAAEAARFGISLGDSHSARSTKRERADRDAEARQLAVEYRTEAKKWESVVGLDDAAGDRYADIHRRIEALDSSRLKVFITDVLASKDLHEVMRAERAVHLLRILAKKDPKGALALFTEHYAAIKISPGAELVISDSLGSWAKDDPVSAVEWMKQNAGEYPDAMKAQSLHNVFHSTAEKDPRLAFTLIAGLGLNDSESHSALHTIVTAAATDEQRNATLAALREYRDAHKGEKETSQAADQMFRYFYWGFKKDGFAAATRWLASVDLNPKELGSFCGEVTLNYKGDEPAQWIEWIGANFPPGMGDDPIMNMIRCWTNQDYEAAGKWLASAPEGPVKNAAIRSYAQEIFPHDRETAMQWIMTLPPSKERQNTLQSILWNSLRNDPEAAAAFKIEHGLK